MIKIEIQEVNNGYDVTIAGAVRNNGRYVYKATELFKLLEDAGAVIVGSKVKVEFK